MEAASHVHLNREDSREEWIANARGNQIPIVVRMKFGEHRAGMKIHEDGVTFHSPSPIPAGRIVEMILCSGALVVDAEIVDCTAIHDAIGGFAVRARYMQSSTEMRNLITEELTAGMTCEETA